MPKAATVTKRGLLRAEAIARNSTRSFSSSSIVSNESPSFPEGFRIRLQKYDPALSIHWNKIKRIWVVEQCIRHVSFGDDKNHAVCQKVFATSGKLEEIHGDRLMNRLIEADTRRKYGEGEDALKKFLRESHQSDIDSKVRETERQREAARLNSLDNKHQLERARTLIQRHDMRPNK
jgi:hypothetical protein